MAPKTAFLASKMHVLGPRAISHRFRWPLDPMLIDVQSPRTTKIIKNTLENKRFCYFALFHFGSKKSPFRTRLGPPNPSKIAPETPPGAPKWPQDGVQTDPWTPKMAVQTSPEPSKPPSRPSKNQFWTSREPPSPDFGRPGSILPAIWRSRASFWTS